MSSQECLKLAVGESEFSCCEANHLEGENRKSIPCSRSTALKLLNVLINSKVQDLVMKSKIVHARLLLVFRQFWIRGLDEEKKSKQMLTLNDLKRLLHWSAVSDGKFVDRESVTLLMYAATMDNLHAVKDVIETFDGDLNNFINLKTQKKGFPYVGIIGSSTAVRISVHLCLSQLSLNDSLIYLIQLITAMTFGSCDVVQILLQNGADPYISDRSGNDPLMCACMFNRLTNVKFWLKHFEKWDLNRCNQLGSTALGGAVYVPLTCFSLTHFVLPNTLTYSPGTWGKIATSLSDI